MTVATYTDLVAARKACRLCPRLINPAAIADPPDSDRLGPYSLWQGNLKAPVVIVAQDFADRSTYQKLKGWPGEALGTNLTLIKLAAEAGIVITPPRIGAPEDVIFTTNAVLCLKEGGMQAAIPSSYYRNCGEKFLRPTIDLISPKAVVTLGRGALNATLHAYNMPRVSDFRALLEEESSLLLVDGSRLFPMAHPSRTVLNTVRSLEIQKNDWRKLGKYLGSA